MSRFNELFQRYKDLEKETIEATFNVLNNKNDKTIVFENERKDGLCLDDLIVHSIYIDKHGTNTIFVDATDSNAVRHPERFYNLLPYTDMLFIYKATLEH